MVRFFPGHDRCGGKTGSLDWMMIAVHNLTTGFAAPKNGWMLDSGGYGRLLSEGEYKRSPGQYVRLVERWSRKVPGLEAAFQQDYPANRKVADSIDRWHHWEEPGDLSALVTRTQERWIHTVDAADRISAEIPVAPVLQGVRPEDYVHHLKVIRHTLSDGDIVGIGNLKTETHDAYFLREVLIWLRAATDLNLRYHALGAGKEVLKHGRVGGEIRRRLWSADSAAWKLEAYYNGNDNHDLSYARRYARDLRPAAPLFDETEAGGLE